MRLKNWCIKFISKNWILPRKTAEKYFSNQAILLDWIPLNSSSKIDINTELSRISLDFDKYNKWEEERKSLEKNNKSK